jgi:diacylglycerol kinase family enzyme
MRSERIRVRWDLRTCGLGADAYIHIHLEVLGFRESAKLARGLLLVPCTEERMRNSRPSKAVQISNTHRRPKVAIVLNLNAGSVTDALVKDVKRLCNHESVYLSRSLEQAQFIARRIVSQKYDVVLCGGGDGTFGRCVSDVTALNPERLPAFGVLRLGTGNGLADALGASPRGIKGILADLKCAQTPEAQRDLALLQVEDRVSTFAGVGLDSMILEDYIKTKAKLSAGPLAKLAGGAAGYALAIASRSIPRYVLQARPAVTVRNEGNTTYRLDTMGQAVGAPIARGEIIYKGPISIAATSTIPFYGLGLRLFPHAEKREGRFQLRLADLGLMEILPYIPLLFSGQFTHPRVYDYACNAVSIEVDKPTAFQIGGDLVGERKKLSMRLTKITALDGARAQPAAKRQVGIHQTLREAVINA